MASRKGKGSFLDKELILHNKESTSVRFICQMSAQLVHVDVSDQSSTKALMSNYWWGGQT